jgi:hypothetical protein
MADLSNSSSISSMMALEGLHEEPRKGVHETLFPHCYRVAEQGIIMMKISAIDELRMYIYQSSKSIANFISGLLNFVDDRINFVDPIPLFKNRLLKSRLIILAKICQLMMLLVKIQFGRFKQKLLT